MTLKNRKKFDAAWHALHELCEVQGRFVSAGEFAKHFGVARNTGWKMLHDMLEMEAIEASMYWRGNVACYIYGTAGLITGGINAERRVS